MPKKIQWMYHNTKANPKKAKALDKAFDKYRAAREQQSYKGNMAEALDKQNIQRIPAPETVYSKRQQAIYDNSSKGMEVQPQAKLLNPYRDHTKMMRKNSRKV